MPDYVSIRGEKWEIHNNALRIHYGEINKIEDIEGLDEINDLKELEINFCPIKEISGLENLRNLRHLKITHSEITSIQNLDPLTNLRGLNLSNNKIKEISSLSNLKNLRFLLLYENKIEIIKGLDNLINLEELSLSTNRINKIQGLEDNSSLKYLFLLRNNIKKITGLDNLENLELLSIDSNHIEEIENLSNLSNLKMLNLSHNKIEVIKNLDELLELNELNLDTNRIREINGLDNNLKLTYLNLANNGIEEIKRLESLKFLRTLLLNDNSIKELKGLDNLTQLSYVDLKNNFLSGKDEYIARSGGGAQKIVEYCRLRRLERIDFLDFITEPDYNVNIEHFRKELNQLDNDDIFINIGSYKESQEFKMKQNSVFIETTPITEYISERDDQLNKFNIHLYQFYSLKGVERDLRFDKVNDFNFFLNRFWDSKGVSKNVLYYNHILRGRAIKKIEEFLYLSIKDYRGIPSMIIFPENTVPYNYLPSLRLFSKEYDITFIGGIEHQKVNTVAQLIFINKAFIISEGKIKYQEKQTPVRIYDPKNLEYLQENIYCQPNPKIKIFETKFGNLSIFICKDFLRLFEIIPEWARRNRVEYIIIPALTSKILPFYSKILNMYNFLSYEDLKIVFANIGGYGGSEFFSIKDYSNRIERDFQLNKRDNEGEKIIIRTIKKKKKKESYYH